MKRAAAFLLILAVLMAGGGAVAEEKLTIAYSTQGVDSDYWYIMERGVAQACEDLGYNYLMQRDVYKRQAFNWGHGERDDYGDEGLRRRMELKGVDRNGGTSRR